MPRVTWLPQVLRAAGLEVIELPGWNGRGVDRLNPIGVVAHHTATPPNAADAAIAALLRDGRPDLKGPLSQLGLDRSGRLWMIADGRCSHNGYGLWGNDAIGIEAFNNGVGEPWAPVQIDAYERACAAICLHLGWSAAQVKGHRETDPHRKIDPTGIDLPHFRAHIGDVMATGRGTFVSNEMELTMGQYEDLKSDMVTLHAGIMLIKAQLEDVAAAVTGTNDTNRDQSIYWNTVYLRSELLSAENRPRLREILRRYGESEPNPDPTPQPPPKA